MLVAETQCIRQSCQTVFILGGTMKISEFSIFYVHFSFYLHLDNFRERCHQPNRSRLPIVWCNHLKALHEKGIGSFKSSLTSSTKLCAMANRSKWGDQVQNLEAPGLDRTAASWVKKNQPMDRFKELQTWHMVDDELPHKKTHCWYFEDVTALDEPFLYFIKVIKSGPITAKFSRTDCSTEPRGHLCVAQVGSLETICRRWTIWLKDSHLNI